MAARTNPERNPDMTSLTNPARKLLRDQLRMDDLKHDPWGTAIGHLFAICDVLSVVDADAIPARWGFRHGAYHDPSLDEMTGEDADYPTCEYAENVLSETLTTEDLVAWGNVLNRFTDLAKRAGHSY